MQARMKNAAALLPGSAEAVQKMIKAVNSGGVPQEILELVHLRASQINGCSACVWAGLSSARKAGMDEDRLGTVAAWRESPFFSEEERVALALTEAVTRLADRSADAVSDDLWNEVTSYFDERQIASLILWIGTTNLFNRINATIQEPAGTTW